MVGLLKSLESPMLTSVSICGGREGGREGGVLCTGTLGLFGY